MIDLIQNINYNVLNYREKLLNYFVNNYKFDKLVKIHYNFNVYFLNVLTPSE